MSITIRKATVADVDAVRSVGLRTWPDAYADVLTPEEIAAGLAEWWSVEAVERTIRDGITLLAEEPGGEAVGMVGLGRHDGKWVMWKLYVLPDRQGKGYGHDLLAAAIEALPAGTDELWLDVLEGNAPAIKFYRRHGFVEVRREDSLVWMRRHLPLTSSAVEAEDYAP